MGLSRKRVCALGWLIERRGRRLVCAISEVLMDSIYVLFMVWNET